MSRFVPLFVAVSLAGLSAAITRIEHLGRPLWRRLQPLTRRYLPVRTARQALLAGAIWGWLPCGLVYTASIAALASGGAGQGALVMLAFGLGTLPVLLATGMAAERLTALLRQRGVRMAGGVLVILFGLWTLPGPHQHWLMGH